MTNREAEQASYLTYEIVYKVKHGKRLIRAYVGDDRETYKQTLRQLKQQSDLRYLSARVSREVVTLYD